MQVNMLEAKNALSRLVAAAERGEDVILARDGKPVAKIVRYQPPKVKRPGAWKGKVKVSPDWDSPETNAEITSLFEESAMRDP
jgi:prevent-host-death family protein